MNLAQRIVLIVGAAILLALLGWPNELQNYAAGGQVFQHWHWNWPEVTVRAALVCVATVAIYFAVGKKQ
jgi:hypothetical protein